MTQHDKLAIVAIFISAIGGVMFIVGFAAMVLHNPRPGRGEIIIQEYVLPAGATNISVRVEGGGGAGKTEGGLDR